MPSRKPARIVGATTVPEATETTPDMVAFREELVSGTAAMAGTRITSP